MGGPGKRDDGLQAGHFSRGSVRPHCARESRKGTWGNRKSKSKGSFGPSDAEMAQPDQVVPNWSEVARSFISALVTDVVHHTGQKNLSDAGPSS